MTFDASDPQEVKRREKAARATARRREEFIAATCATSTGREFLWNQLVDAHIFQTVYDDNPHRMYFMEGERTRGLALLGEIMQVAPDAFILMMREANERDTVAQQSRRPNGHGRDQGSIDDDPDDDDDDRADLNGDDPAYYNR